MKSWLIMLMVGLLGLFIVYGLILTIPASYGIQNQAIIFSMVMIIIGLAMFLKLFNMF